jgi:GH15 family glucan-1,4-alpha-glucosidase
MENSDSLHKKSNLGYAPWAILASLAGYAIGRGILYGQRLLRQPRLAYDLAANNAVTREEIEAQALEIAVANVRGCIETRHLLNGQRKRVLCAGVRNFREPWARDFSFASFGLLEIGEAQVVKEGLEVFFTYQRPSGQMPVKAHSTSVVGRYLHSFLERQQPVDAPLKPKYITAHNTISLDGNGLLVIAALNYASRTGDHAFGRTHWSALKQAIMWMESHATFENGLLHQSSFTDWADSIARAGHILYTNIIYWKALHDLAEAAEVYGQVQDKLLFTVKAEHVKQAIYSHFWRESQGYFVTSKLFNILSSSGNLLAIAWGLATKEQAHHILDSMEGFGMADPVPTQVTHRAYPSRYIALENRLAGIAHYHTHAAWLWLGAWHVIALARQERCHEAETLLYRISQVIVRDGVVHEVYGLDGRHLATRWYISEAPLTWNAAMVAYAYHVLKRKM